MPLAQEVKLASLPPRHALRQRLPQDGDGAGAGDENEHELAEAEEDVDCAAVYLKCLVESVLKYIKKFTAAMARIEFMRIW